MKNGGILGYDLNEKTCQISYYDTAKDEPQTLETASGTSQIPLVLGYFKDHWIYGREAKRLQIAGAENTVYGGRSPGEGHAPGESKDRRKGLRRGVASGQIHPYDAGAF